MALDNYEGAGQIQINGRTLAEADTVRMRNISNNNRVYTMRKGLAGHSKGPNETEFAVTNAVPKAGLEDDFVEKVLSGEYFDITFVSAGKRYIVQCWCEDSEFALGSRDAAEFSFNCVGGPPRIL